MSRYLTVHLSVTARYSRSVDPAQLAARAAWESERRSWIDESPPPAELLQRRMVTIADTETAGAAASRMAREQTGCAIVTGPGQLPVGLLTTAHLAASAPDEAICRLALSPVATAPPGDSLAGYWLRLIAARIPALAITADGSATSPPIGQLNAGDLAILCGRDPAGLLNAILTWRDSEDLPTLLERSRILIAETLTSPGAVERGALLSTEFHRAAIERLTAESAAGQPVPPIVCWCGTGETGRGETLGAFAPSLAAIAEDGCPPERMEALAQAVQRRTGGTAPTILSRSGWRDRYSALIRNPILHSIWGNRTLFDLRFLSGSPAEAADLIAHIAAEVSSDPAFVRILANDTLAQVPPLTFFRGFVIDLEGGSHRTLDLDTEVILPIVDSARVFSLSVGASAVTHTVARLEAARLELPESAAVLLDAAEAFRTASWLRARLDGPVVEPAALDKFDQGLLSSVFAATHALLELTASRFGFEFSQ